MEGLKEADSSIEDGEHTGIIEGTEIIMQNLQIFRHEEICGESQDSERKSNLPSSAAIMGGHPEIDPQQAHRLPIVETTTLGSELEESDNRLLGPALKGK